MKRPPIDFTRMRTVPVRVGKHERLARYGWTADSGFWDGLWATSDPFAASASIPAGAVSSRIARRVGAGARVIEAGCGDGRMVHMLDHLGLECVGVDYAPRTVSRLAAALPHCRFVCGDIRALPFADGSFDAYVSLGVIEHFEDSDVADLALAEARRCLRPGAALFMSVPRYNPLRRVRTAWGLWAKDGGARPFFEYCMSADDLTDTVERAGFVVEETWPGSSYTAVEQDMFMAWMFYAAAGTAADRVLRKIVQLCFPRRWFGHMLYLCGRRR